MKAATATILSTEEVDKQYLENPKCDRAVTLINKAYAEGYEIAMIEAEQFRGGCCHCSDAGYYSQLALEQKLGTPNVDIQIFLDMSELHLNKLLVAFSHL